jgi:hypothetical protein
MQVWSAIDLIGSRYSRLSCGDIQTTAIPILLARQVGVQRDAALAFLQILLPVAPLARPLIRRTRRQSKTTTDASDLFAKKH